MEITAEITGIEYQRKLESKLKEFEFDNFNINTLPSSCIINYDNYSFGLSKWVSPKRSRTYPYERVYNTLGCSKRITVIPIIKEEGKKGDRDYIQWDTVSLMSLLDVYLILTYYQDAEKKPQKVNKITNQKMDNEIVVRKINAIKSYHSSALHWNLKEVNSSFPELINQVKSFYQNITEKLNVKLHSISGIEKFEKQFIEGVNTFMKTSRMKAKDAQARENLTVQPKERLSTSSKSVITIKNYLGGIYYFTTDEVKIIDKNIYLIEGKHSKITLLPAKGDIKDGLLKMILYTNLVNVKVGDKEYNKMPLLRLTSLLLKGSIDSNSEQKEIDDFLIINKFTKSLRKTINDIFSEANENKFSVIIEYSK